MKPIGLHNYFVYITTNKNKNVFYTGVTNNLENRLNEHLLDSLGPKKHFAGKYNCIYLIYFERYQFIEQAIKREKEIKGWRRSKKVELINSLNKNWDFLNDTIKD
jgi:putative endonuclease